MVREGYPASEAAWLRWPRPDSQVLLIDPTVTRADVDLRCLQVRGGHAARSPRPKPATEAATRNRMEVIVGSERTTRAVVGAALAVAAISPVAAGTTPSAEGWSTLALAKECSSFAGQVGDHCTITASNLDAIPTGTLARYYGPVLEATFVSSMVILDAGDGNTAVGYCSVGPSGEPLGMCSFTGGSGTLAGFRAIIAVTVDADGEWHWDGLYQLPSAG